VTNLENIVSSAFKDRNLLEKADTTAAIHEVIRLLDAGQLRAASKTNGGWVVHPWVKEAILLYFQLQEMQVMECGPYEFFDKIPLKHGFREAGVRVVPPSTARYGSFMARGAILIGGYVNIGAYVGEGTMVDTWALVGSCAQVGSGVHLSAGVCIGGVLEPATARPVIIEDGAFIGSHASVVEGVTVEAEAVLGANVSLTASTDIIDITGTEPVIHRGRVPARSVVIPGTRPKRFAAGEYQVQCALIIGTRTESTDRKTSLNEALRQFDIRG
jgi:2,3,4,5-tetrahydropyridine-2-carboxylate N-succinyltransferase